jgi:hypothetical protein
MLSLVVAILRSLAAAFHSRRHLAMENLALRHQLLVLKRTVIGERHLLRVLDTFFEYYHPSRPHRSLTQDSPVPRPVMTPVPGRVVEFPQVGGLHHLYIRQAA